MLGARVISTVSRRSMSGAFTGSVVSGPPRHHVPFAEKMALAGLMTVCFLAYPSWVMVNLQKYKGQ